MEDGTAVYLVAALRVDRVAEAKVRGLHISDVFSHFDYVAVIKPAYILV
jgi:hypothetical protein